jgi:carbamoyl-phosphate synthase small subunit
VEVSHVGLNDDVVEGLRLLEAPAFSVQFHPESAAGPHDAAPLFQRFVDLMETTRQDGAAVSPPPVVEHSTGEKN